MNPKEKALTLYPWEVRAILEGRKSQFRRPVKPQPVKFPQEVTCAKWLNDGFNTPGFYVYSSETKALGSWGRQAPYAVGQRLWGRETFCCTIPEGVCCPSIPERRSLDVTVHYRATDPNPRCGWFASTQMPRWASRITLEVKAIRAERVQDISEADAWEEGMQSFFDDFTLQEMAKFQLKHERPEFPRNSLGMLNAAGWYATLWNHTHGPRAWDKNEWVWVYEFVRVEGC